LAKLKFLLSTSNIAKIGQIRPHPNHLKIPSRNYTYAGFFMPMIWMNIRKSILTTRELNSHSCFLSIDNQLSFFWRFQAIGTKMRLLAVFWAVWKARIGQPLRPLLPAIRYQRTNPKENARWPTNQTVGLI